MVTASETQSASVIGVARRTVGIGLLLLVVVLWTTSNFLGSVRSKLALQDNANLCLSNR